MGAYDGGYPRQVVDIRDATPDDVEQVHELLAARNRAAFGMSEVTRGQVEADFRRLGVDRWVAANDGDVIGYAHLTSTHDVVYAGTDPDAGDALLDRVVERARERGFDDLGATVVREDAPLHALVQRHGFVHEGDVLRMWRELEGELPEARWPDGVAVRTYTDADGPRVHALLDAAYSEWDETYVPESHDEWLAFMTDHDEFDPELWFLVERNGELVACGLHWKEHQRRGWVKDLVVESSERGRGLGKALLHHGLRAYGERDVDRVGLKVDSTNPTGAPQLYERVGFAIDRRYGMWRRAL
jgi:mycothiol synthase